MSSAVTRRNLILLGAVLVSLFLGAAALKRDFPILATATLTPRPVVLISLTPTDTPSQTPAPSRTPIATQTPKPSATLTASATLTPTVTQTFTPSPTFTPWPTPDAKARTREVKVPILMYHHVGPLPNNADAIRTGLTVLPDNFEQQLQFYKAKGYQSVDFYQMYYAITLGWDLPPKPMIFTFDDAYQDVYDFAFPIMKKYGYTGTIFVPTQFIDEGRADYMSWDELMEMHAAGWRLEPHTKTHEDVTNRKRDWLIYQIYGSMDTLRYHLGYQPRFFAYPSGAHDDKAIAVLKEVGFWGAVTTDGEWYHDLKKAYIWGRVRIGGDYVLKDIANLLGEKYP
jgi:peptidoglycan/xylan/chitin deacetylase (PgdA/CDA1 family)